MRRSLLARWSVSVASVAAAVLAVMTGVAPAQAITHGSLDGDNHPFVGFMIAKDLAGTPLVVCTGTLLSPTVFLTAGHCTQPPAVTADIWFDPDLTDVAANNLPFSGDARGTTHTHPDFDPSDFTFRDLGVVVLDEPVVMDEYGALPALNALDAWQTRRGLQDTTFTTVGYGVQRLFPESTGRPIEYQRLRMVATPRLVQMNSAKTGDFSLLVSANANTGGTCLGDSGGPNFIGTSNVVAAVTSYAVNDLCRGTAGVFRMDRLWSLDWVNGFLHP